MASRPRLIVFDCDGTLADSQHLVSEAMRLAFSGVELPAPPRLDVLKTSGLSLAEVFSRLAPDASPAVRRDLVDAYRSWHTRLRDRPELQEPLFKGASRLLHDLAEQQDTVLGIATGKSRRALLHFLDAHRLRGLFATLQTADDAPSKPHPAMLRQAMAETGVPASSTVMIGDTAYDMTMAVCAGTRSVGVAWGYHPLSALKEAGASGTADDFEALTRLLQSEAFPQLQTEAA